MSSLLQTLSRLIFPRGKMPALKPAVIPTSRHILSMLLVISGFLEANAQSQIRGVVADVQKKPIANANVSLLNSIDSTIISETVADQEGAYVFRGLLLGTYKLKITAVGYEHLISAAYTIVSAQDDVNAGFLLMTPKRDEMHEVVVRAKKPLFEQKIDRTIVNVRSGITSAGTNVLDVLERSPGISVNRQNGTISMAGKDGVLVMINGKISYMPLNAVIQMLAGMNAANVDKIELITTPPANYDAEGNAGFINIVTVSNPDQGMNGSITGTLGYGKGERAAGSGNFNYRKDRFNLFGDYSFSLDKMDQVFSYFRKAQQDGNILQNATISDRNTSQRNHLARLGFDYQLSRRTSLAGLAGMYDNKWSMDAINNNATFLNGVKDSAMKIANDEINHWKHYMGNISIQHQFTENQKITANIDYLYYHDNNPVNYFTNVFEKSGELVSSEQSRSGKETPIRIWVGSIDYARKFNARVRMEAGVKGSSSNFENNVLIENFVQGQWFTDPSLSAEHVLNEDIAAAFTSFNINPDSKTEVKAGLRYEYTNSELADATGKTLVDRNFGKLFPSVFVTRKFDKNHSIGLSYSRRITRPTFNDMAPFVIFIDPNTFYSGNPALKPAIGDIIKADYTYKKYLLSFAYSHTHDAIARYQTRIDPATNKQIFASENFNNVKSISITVSFPVSISNWWTMQNNAVASWQQVTSDVDDQKLQLKQKTIRINSAQTFTLPADFSVELSGFYQTESMFGTAKLEPYGMINAGVQKKLGKGKLRFGIDDIFNSMIWETSVRIPEQNLDAITNYKFTQRVFKLTYTRTFGNDKLKEKRSRTTGSEDERGRVN